MTKAHDVLAEQIRHTRSSRDSAIRDLDHALNRIEHLRQAVVELETDLKEFEAALVSLGGSVPLPDIEKFRMYVKGQAAPVN